MQKQKKGNHRVSMIAFLAYRFLFLYILFLHNTLFFLQSLLYKKDQILQPFVIPGRMKQELVGLNNETFRDRR